MKDLGKVEIVSGNKAIVKLTKNDNCDKCGYCKFDKTDVCNLLVTNTKKAKVGDDVEIVSTERDYSILIKFFYCLPMIMLLVGFLVGMLFQNELLQFGFACGLFAISMIIMAFVVKFMNKKPKIVYILTDVIKKVKDENIEKIEKEKKENVAENSVEQITTGQIK